MVYHRLLRPPRTRRSRAEDTAREQPHQKGQNADDRRYAHAKLDVRIILTRLATLRLRGSASRPESGAYPSLVRRFRVLLEQQYRHSRAFSAYARQLHCAPRTLQRAVERVTGQTGKRFIDARVMLEAKRLLAHTNDPVGAIGAALGFSEPTNFVKYFQRHEGVSPERFRQRYR